MGIGRLSGTAFTLSAVVLLLSCGGVGVSKRSQLENSRPGSDRTSVNNVEREDASLRAPESGRSVSSIEAYFDPWLNAPYELGGDSYSGIDCSGLVDRFFTDFYSIDVPENTTTQYSGSISVPVGKEKPGDLVFFKNTNRAGISHVGIYLGENRFVHAANSGVEINHLTGEYYQSRFAGFRRFEK